MKGNQHYKQQLLLQAKVTMKVNSEQANNIMHRQQFAFWHYFFGDIAYYSHSVSMKTLHC